MHFKTVSNNIKKKFLGMGGGIAIQYFFYKYFWISLFFKASSQQVIFLTSFELIGYVPHVPKENNNFYSVEV